MKSEERHQLLQNDLQTVTAKVVGFFERHLKTLLIVVFGVLLVVAAVAWWSRSAQSENAAGWTMLDSALNSAANLSAANLEEFGTVVDKFKGKPPGQWAQLQISEKTLQSAMPLMFTDRDIALTELKRSREGFESLLQDKTVPPVVRERALWGLALCLETGCDGDTSKPIEAYERLLSEFQDSIFKAVADERINALKKPSARDFYAWFSKEKPNPPEVRPKDFKTDGAFPSDLKMFDNEPDEFKPIIKSDKKEGEAKPDVEKPVEPDKPVEDNEPAGKEPPKQDEKPTEKN